MDQDTLPTKLPITADEVRAVLLEKSPGMIEFLDSLRTMYGEDPKVARMVIHEGDVALPIRDYIELRRASQ